MKKKLPLSKKLFFSMTDNYLNHYLSSVLKRSPHTIDTYKDSLTSFRRYVVREKKISITKIRFSDCTRDFVLDYCVWISESGAKPSTRNLRLTVLKQYFLFASDEDASLSSLALAVTHVPSIKNPHEIGPTLENKVVKAYLAAPDDTELGRRDQFILVILYDTAIRLEELVELALSDLLLVGDSPHVLVHGKGNKERIVPFSDEGLEHAKAYIRHFHQGSSPDTPLIYIEKSRVKHPMSRRNVQRIVKKYADYIRAGFPDMPASVHPHMIRRTRGTDIYQENPIELVAQILGHESIETTKNHYAKESREMLREVMEKTNKVGYSEKEEWNADEEDRLAAFCGLG